MKIFTLLNDFFITLYCENFSLLKFIPRVTTIFFASYMVRVMCTTKELLIILDPKLYS